MAEVSIMDTATPSSYSIGMASVLAKVERDNLMIKYAELYPEYGFEDHWGYGTRHHIEMIKSTALAPYTAKPLYERYWRGRE